MLAAGMSALAMLYATQALLPDVGAAFGVGATAASLTVAVSTGALALTVLPMSALAERWGRTRVMVAGLAVASASVLGAAAAPSFGLLLAFRAVDGVALATVVAVAMGHISTEVAPGAATAAIGVYVSGTTVGGLVGRLVPAGVSEFASWRWSMAALAGVGAAGTVLFARVVPPPRFPAPRAERGVVRAHLRDRGIVRLCVVALLLMGGFVATYNYLTYRLSAAPFRLSPSVVGLVFLAYLAGTVTSTLAARLAQRVGRRRVVVGSILLALCGLAVTLVDVLPLILAGVVVFTAGYFAAHSVASGWTSSRAAGHKSQAAALYLLSYYLGSGIGGTVIGLAWADGGWPATVAAVAGCYVLAAVVALGVRPTSCADAGSA
ncbi:MFS transporter [Jatrophihabitans fulvus]